MGTTAGAGAVSGSRIAGIEVIDLKADAAANCLTIQLKDVFNMSGLNLFNCGSIVAVSGSGLASGIAKHQALSTKH